MDNYKKQILQRVIDFYIENSDADKKTIRTVACLMNDIESINYTHCCESDSEQFPSFLYKHEGGLYFKHLEDTDITDQWNEYLKTR